MDNKLYVAFSRCHSHHTKFLHTPLNKIIQIIIIIIDSLESFVNIIIIINIIVYL